MDFLAIDSNLYTLDAYDGEKFVTISLKQSLKYSMEVKRARVSI